MSKTHTVKAGDLLYLLSTKYYGVPGKWQTIVNANPQLKGRGKASDGSPLIFKGDVLIIPENIETIKPETVINAESKDQVTIKINGNKFAFFSDFNLTTEINSLDTFNFTAPFNPDDIIYRDAFRPFSYTKCDVFYGSQLWFSGLLLAPQSQSSTDSKTISLSGYPKCGILNDSCLSISKFPIEFNNQDLQKIANIMISDFGISSDFPDGAGNPFKKVTPEPENKILEFLIELANQRGLLLTNNALGNLVFWKAKTGTLSATFKEGETPFMSCAPTFNPQDFYSHITGIMPAKQGTASEKFTVINNYLASKGITKHYNYTISDAEQSDIQTAVKSKAGFMFANSVQYQLTVQGHRNRTGELYQKNTLISVLAPGAMIYNDTKFLIKKASLSRSSDGGDVTILDLVLPESYSGQIPAKLPFEE
jgi:prophage tail gpP-like protein